MQILYIMYEFWRFEQKSTPCFGAFNFSDLIVGAKAKKEAVLQAASFFLGVPLFHWDLSVFVKHIVGLKMALGDDVDVDELKLELWAHVFEFFHSFDLLMLNVKRNSRN